MSVGTTAQVIYFIDESNNEVISYDLGTCESCVVYQAGVSYLDDLLILPNGNLLVAEVGIPNYSLEVVDVVNGTSTAIQMVPDPFGISSYIQFNGLIYIFAYNGLYLFDYTNGSVSFVGGPWPSGLSSFEGEFIIDQGNLYYIQSVNNVWLIDINAPENSMLAISNPLPTDDYIGFTTLPNGEHLVLSRGPTGIFISNYDLISGNISPIPCGDLLGSFPYLNSVTIDGLTHLPPGVPAPPCLCLTEAGTVTTNPITACVPGDVTLIHQGDESLGTADVLNFILFTNPVDTLGSVLVQQSSSTFTYDPNLLTPGITYYLAAVAGPDAGNGLVDLSGSSGCIDLSEATPVVWQPVPEVVFVAGTTELCPEACVTVTAQLLTGTPPFNVAGQLLDNTGSVVGSFNETILTTSGDFTLCAPAGVQGLTVQATQVGHAVCGCD